MKRLTQSQSHRLHNATVAALLRAIRRIGIRQLKRRPIVKATQEPLPWDEPGPAHSTEFGKLQGWRDSIVEEAFEKTPPDEQKT